MLISPDVSIPRFSLKRGARDGGVYDKHRDGSAEYYSPSGSVRHYNPRYYSDEDRSDEGDYSSESPSETDSERDGYRDRGPGRGHYVSDDRGAVHVPDSESSSEEGVPDSESETETDDVSDRYVPEGYESSSAYDRDDRDSYGDSYDDWDDYDDDDYGGYDGMFVLLFTRFPTSVCSFLLRLRRRLLRLLLLDPDYRNHRRLIIITWWFTKLSQVYIHPLFYYQSVPFGNECMSDMFRIYVISLDHSRKEPRRFSVCM